MWQLKFVWVAVYVNDCLFEEEHNKDKLGEFWTELQLRRHSCNWLSMRSECSWGHRRTEWAKKYKTIWRYTQCWRLLWYFLLNVSCMFFPWPLWLLIIRVVSDFCTVRDIVFIMCISNKSCTIWTKSPHCDMPCNALKTLTHGKLLKTGLYYVN